MSCCQGARKKVTGKSYGKKNDRKNVRTKKSRHLQYLYFFAVMAIKVGRFLKDTLSLRDGLLSFFLMHIPDLEV